MLSAPLRSCFHTLPSRNVNYGILGISQNNIGQIVAGIGRKAYSKDKEKNSCCKDIVQTQGKTVEPWPKPDPPSPGWRAECPQDPYPPNYDPYRIKVPDVVVPPLPPSNAKEIPNEDSRELFKSLDINFRRPSTPQVQDLFHNSHIVHPDYWKDKPVKLKDANANSTKDVLPKLGYHGRNKYKYAFHEPWKPLDRMALLEQAEKHESGLVDEAEATSNKQLT